jgi:hypothetical protein
MAKVDFGEFSFSSTVKSLDLLFSGILVFEVAAI